MTPQGREMRNGRNLSGAALGHGSQRSRRHQEAPLIWTDPLCLLLLLPHREQAAAQDPHAPCLHSPGTDSPATLTTAGGHIPLPAQRPSMEVTNVSPSPTSRPEGDDLCEIDVTNVAIHSVALLICLCGLAGNGAVLCLLNLKDCNYGLFNLAVADILFLLFTIPSTFLFLVEEVSCSPIMRLLYLSFLFQLSLVSYYRALYRLMPSNIVVFMDKLVQHYWSCNFPLRLQWLLGSVQYWAFFALFTLIPTVTSLCPSHEKEHCRAALISVFSVILLLFVAPVLISSTIDFIKAKWGSQQQQPKRRDIVTFIIVVFTVFLSICSFLLQLGYTIVSTQIVFLLICIYSSIKPFIYFFAGRCWRPCSVESLRLSLQRVFEEPEEKTAPSNDTTVGLRLLFPFSAQQDTGTVAECSLKSSD